MNELITFAFIGGIGVPEIIAILVVGLLLFGKRLPEVGRRAGKTFIEFKRGVRGLKDQIYDLDSLAEQEAAGEDHSYEQVIGQIDPAADDVVVEAGDENDYHDHHQYEDDHEDDHEDDDSEHVDADETNDTPKD